MIFLLVHYVYLLSVMHVGLEVTQLDGGQLNNTQMTHSVFSQNQETIITRSSHMTSSQFVPSLSFALLEKMLLERKASEKALDGRNGRMQGPYLGSQLMM